MYLGSIDYKTNYDNKYDLRYHCATTCTDGANIRTPTCISSKFYISDVMRLLIIRFPIVVSVLLVLFIMFMLMQGMIAGTFLYYDDIILQYRLIILFQIAKVLKVTVNYLLLYNKYFKMKCVKKGSYSLFLYFVKHNQRSKDSHNENIIFPWPTNMSRT